jgi:hypothetical protein
MAHGAAARRFVARTVTQTAQFVILDTVGPPHDGCCVRRMNSSINNISRVTAYLPVGSAAFCGYGPLASNEWSSGNVQIK